MHKINSDNFYFLSNGALLWESVFKMLAKLHLHIQCEGRVYLTAAKFKKNNLLTSLLSPTAPARSVQYLGGYYNNR